jgi:hypothetical protein
LKGEFLPEEPFTEAYQDHTNLDETMLDTITLSQDLKNWNINHCKTTIQPNILLKCLLNGHDLKGISLEKFPIKEGVYVWARITFRDYWLDL